MAAYLVAQVEVTNPDAYQDYASKVPDVIAQYGGKYLARGGDVVALEGGDVTGRVVVLQFESIDAAKAFYNSPEYQKILPMRLANSNGKVFLVAGV